MGKCRQEKHPHANALEGRYMTQKDVSASPRACPLPSSCICNLQTSQHCAASVGIVTLAPRWGPLLEPITDTSDERIPISGLPKIFQEAAESQSPMPTILGSTQFASCKMTQKMGMTRFALVVCLSTVPLPCPIPREDALNYCG